MAVLNLEHIATYLLYPQVVVRASPTSPTIFARHTDEDVIRAAVQFSPRLGAVLRCGHVLQHVGAEDGAERSIWEGEVADVTVVIPAALTGFWVDVHAHITAVVDLQPDELIAPPGTADHQEGLATFVCHAASGGVLLILLNA